MKRTLAFGAGMAFSGLLLAAASEQVSVVDPYVRQAPPNAPATGAFMVIKNNGERAVRVVAASNPASRITELHGHANEDGVMKMRPVAAIEVAPGGEAVLKPGGLHVMLIDLAAPLRAGDSVPITLGFDDGSTLRVDARVIRPTVQAIPAGHK